MSAAPAERAAPVTPLPQLTVKAILLSIVLTIILASANAYVGLFAGLTVATAIPAAVISMAVLPLFGRVEYSREQHRGHRRLAPAARFPPARSSRCPRSFCCTIGRASTTGGPWPWSVSAACSACCSRCRCAARSSWSRSCSSPKAWPQPRCSKVGANPGMGAKFLGVAAVVGGAFKLVTSGLRWLPETLHGAGLRRRTRHCLLRLRLLAGAARGRLHRRLQRRRPDRGAAAFFPGGWRYRCTTSSS